MNRRIFCYFFSLVAIQETCLLLFCRAHGFTVAVKHYGKQIVTELCINVFLHLAVYLYLGRTSLSSMDKKRAEIFGNFSLNIFLAFQI